MREQGADLLVFCGGDGTARDHLSGAGERISPYWEFPAGREDVLRLLTRSIPGRRGNSCESLSGESSWPSSLREVMDLDEARICPAGNVQSLRCTDF